MLIISNMGDQVWLITSRQTEPDLECKELVEVPARGRGTTEVREGPDNSSMFG